MAKTSAASNAAARRSISIFSRRGGDTSSPVDTAATDTKSKGKWKLRRHSDQSWGSELQKIIKETAPPTAVVASPKDVPTKDVPTKDDVLRSLGMSPVMGFEFPKTTLGSSKAEDAQALGSQMQSSWNRSTSMLQSFAADSTPQEERPKTSDGLDQRPLSASSSTSSNSAKSPRPRIQVMIPDNGSKTFPFVPFQDRELSMSGRRGHTRSYSENTISRVSSLDSFMGSPVSPLEEDGETKLQRLVSVRNAVQSAIHIHQAAMKQHLQVPAQLDSSSHDGSSNDSISGDEDASISRSHRSSITSFESQTEQVMSQSKPAFEPEDEEEETISRQVSSPTPSTPTLGDLIHLVRTPSTQQRPTNPRRAFSSGNVCIPRTLTEARNEDDRISPTLSEAERNLEVHLTNMSPTTSLVVEAWLQEEISREFSIRRKPCPPPKSEKRMSRVSSTSSIATVDNFAFTPAPEPPKRAVRFEPPATPKKSSIKRSSSVRSVLSLIAEDDERQISSDEAERVIHLILSKTHDLADLFSLSLINGGFYRVAKKQEIQLMHSALFNMSPAAYEFQRLTETIQCDDDSAHPGSELSGTQFYKDFVRDSDIIGNIKIMILERCQSILRPDTVKLLAASHNPFRASRVDDALWRIWTFCLLFGGEKDREDDLAAQLDWLRGGIEAKKIAEAIGPETDERFLDGFEMDLLSENFGKGNGAGLTADELYDVTELWNCVRTISQKILGRTEQARQYGVFDDTDIRGGDIDGEEIMLGKFIDCF
jgi:hypothetical protein